MKKILFNDKYGHTQAVINGIKTMLRKIVPQVILDKVPEYQQRYFEETLDAISAECAIENMVGPESMFRCSYQPGEVVAVAQSYETIKRNQLADYMNPVYNAFFRAGPPLEEEAGWTNKRLVKPELMPHRIRIVDFRVNKLQDISDEDCLKEGIIVDNCKTHFNGYAFQWCYDQYENILAERWYRTPREAYAALIDKLSGKGTWNRNPYVFAYQFKLEQ